MPLFIDPRWEYWTPNPEVEEVLRWAARSKSSDVFKVLGLEYEDRQMTDQRGKPSGFRIGWGHPDRHPPFKLGPAKRVRESKLPVNKVCQGCGRLFNPDRASRKCCSAACVAHAGRARELLDRNCQLCGATFSPREATQVMCSILCASRRATAVRQTASLDRHAETLTRMWRAGERVVEIATVLGVTVGWVKKMRRRLGLDARPSGNRSRSKAGAG